MESIGGYRIIRKLGSGSRSDVFLGHAGPGAQLPPVAIKLFRTGVTAASVDTEIAALARLDSRHMVRLLDLASAANGTPCLILQRLDPAGLPRLLGGRAAIAAGEAVTILAPLAAAVTAMHRWGVVHGAIAAPAVLFDEAVAPVLAGFGACSLIGESPDPLTAAELDAHAGVGADVDAMRRLAGAVLSRVATAPPGLDAITRWLERPAASNASFPDELQERLFALAEPMPVRIAADVQHRPAVPPRLGQLDGAAPGLADATANDPASSTTNRLRRAAERLPLPGGLVRRLPGLADVLRNALMQVGGSVGAVRRRTWVVAALGAAAVVAAALLNPGPDADGAVPQPIVAATRAPSGAVDASAVTGDDPLAAARDLLNLRATCLHDRSVLCLDGVDQPDSAAWRADAERIRALQRGGEVQPDVAAASATPALVDRMGDSALVALLPAAEADAAHVAASVLMVRTEAGWRFRSLLPGGQQAVG